MALRRRQPLDLLGDLEQRLNELFPSHEEEDDSSDVGLTSWKPRVDIFEEDTDFIIQVEAPGVKKDDIEVSVDNNRLTVRGDRHEEREASDGDRNYYRAERLYGTFQRSFTLPDTVDSEQIEAEFDEGVLSITMPKSEESRSRQVQIQ